MMTRQMRAAVLKAKARGEGGTRGEQQQHDALLVLESSCDYDEEAEEEAYCFMAPALTQPLTMEEELNGTDRDKLVDEEVFMSQPPGYEDGTGRVWKLKKVIYGLKQAPRCWYKKLASVLDEIGFRASTCDESLFLMGEKEALVMFLVYVDDIVLFESSKQEVLKVQQKLMQNFKCKTLGEANYCLGMHIQRDINNGWVKLHKEKYIKDMGHTTSIQVQDCQS
ncbi:unnamed protein product [Closterium sp. NIES-54]